MAPVPVEQNSEIVTDQVIPVPEQETDDLPFGDDEQTTLPQSEPDEETDEQSEEKTDEETNKGYRVIRTDKIQNLPVGTKYKREDKPNCKTWTVLLNQDGKILVSSSPKNTHNPRKEADLDVVVIELI